MPSHFLVILNPAAGQDDFGKCLEIIETFFKEADLSFEVRCTKGEGDALEWARAAEGFDRLIAGGGDGTVMEALSGMMKNPRPVPLAQLPLGTANVLARALAVPSDLGSALRMAVSDGVAVSMDVGYLPDHDRYFALVAGSGWDARLIEDATRKMKDRLGFFAYVFTGIKNLFEHKPSRVRLTIDGETRRVRAHNVMAINVGELYESGIALGEDISPHDGRLDVAIASPRSVPQLFTLVFRLLTRRFDGSRELQYFSAETLEVDASPPMKLEIDGEAIGETPFRVEVVPSGARLVVSPDYASTHGISFERLEGDSEIASPS